MPPSKATMSQKTNSLLLHQISASILAISLITFLAWQNLLSNQTSQQLEKAIEQRELIIEQTTLSQTKTAKQMESFLSDLLTLAESDPQAAALINRYEIHRQNTPATQEAPEAN
jgi:cell division protein FtsL